MGSLGFGVALHVGVDVGTTSIKAVLVDETGVLVGSFRKATPWDAVPTGREMTPSLLWSAVLALLREAEAFAHDRQAGTIATIGITSMGQTGTFVDGNGRADRPMVSWDDIRSRPAAERLHSELGTQRFAGIAGLPIDASWTVCQLHQMHETLPTGSSTWLGVADYLAFCLTGNRRAEYSLACQSGMVDFRKRMWSPELLEWAGGSTSLLPPLGSSVDPVGFVTGNVCRGARVHIAGHDHLAACVGANAARRGVLYDSCGTAETLVRTVAVGQLESRVVELVSDGLQIGCHVVEGQMSVTGSHRATWGLERIRRLIGLSIEELSEIVEPKNIRVVGVLDDEVTISLVDGDPLALWTAANRAVAEATRLLALKLARFCGPADETIIAGGWLRNPPFVAARSAVLPSSRPSHQPEAGAYGAAIIAARALNDNNARIS